MKKLSICIPTYNRISFLEKTINTILLSDRDDFDLVICDNFSKDKTEVFCIDKSKNDNRLKYFRNESNLGISTNIFKCVFNADSDYIYFLSDEDELNTSMIDKIFKLLDYNYNAILSSVYDTYNDCFYIKRKNEYFKYFNSNLIHQTHTYISGIIVKKNCLDLNLLKKYTQNKDNIYQHIPSLIMCYLSGNCFITSEVLCNKGEQQMRSSNTSFLDEKFISNEEEKPFYHLDNRTKQLIFFNTMTYSITNKSKFRKIIFKHFARWAVSIFYSDFIIKNYGIPKKQTLINIKKIKGIGQYFNFELLKYNVMFYLRVFIKKIIFWNIIKKYFV